MDRLDKAKAVAKQRAGKPKVPAPPGELIALGSKPKPEAEPGPSSKAPALSSARREAQPPVGLLLPLSKKTVLPYAPSTSSKAVAVDYERSSASHAQYDEAAIECAPAEFYDTVVAAYDANDDERIERLLCGAVRYLKNSRAKPDNQIVLALVYFSKAHPDMFTGENVTAAFSSLLKRDPSINFKSKGNPLVTVLACNVLYAAFASEEQWPDIFLKVFLEDSMGERIWVDRADCRCFTENIITAYGTKLPPRSLMVQDAAIPLTPGTPAANSTVPTTTSPSSTPRASSGYPDEEPMELGSVPAAGGTGSSSSAALAAISDRLDGTDEPEPIVLPRYLYQQEAIERQTTEFMNEQFGKRQPVDVSSRQLLKTIATMSGIVDVRLAAVQRLEMWLQNPKLSRSAQDLLLFVCYNCGQRGIGMGDPKELEVATQLLKLRLKTKQLLSHYLICIKELMSQNDYNLHTVVALTVYNELSNSRNSNNMAVLGTAVQVSPEKASAILAEVFLDLLMNKEDYLRALRTLLREIVRSIRNDLDFPAFCLALMTERKAEKFNELDTSTKERLFPAIADLVALSQLLCITPSVREAVASASKGERRDIQSMRFFWKQVSTIQRDSVWWMQDVVPTSFDLSSQDYIAGLYKILMMQPAENYYKVDGWPPESERQSILRIATETPVREDTLIRILIIGLTANLPLNATDALDVVDLMVRRAAAAATNIAGHVGIHGASLLEVSNLDLIQLLFSAAAYHHPESIKLPKGYEPPCLAIAASYWKVWQMLLIITAFNPTAFGRFAWDSYETLRLMMEMVMTNNYRYPPPTTSPDDSVTQMYLQKERQAIEHEKQLILEFEVHLAAASSKNTITEQNSHLLSRLMAMDPTGNCRKPPDEVLDSLKTMNKTMNLGSLLCRSRNPDFLLSIIGRQGTAGSMPWLADLVEASEGSLDVLPVQCLCEFLLLDAPTPLPSSAVPSSAAAAMLSPDEAVSAAALSARRKSSSSSIMSAVSAFRDGDSGEHTERLGRSVSVQASKHDKLVARLRSTLFTPDVLTSMTVSSASEILAYFLQRLQLPSSASRAAALKGLASVLAGGQRRGRDNAMDTDDECRNATASAADTSSQRFGWLLDDLPTIPAYQHVKALVVTRLCEALRVESSADALEAYMTYLSRECLDCDDHLLANTVEALSRTLIERSVVLCSLLVRSSCDSSGRRSDLQSALILAYREFTRRARGARWPVGNGAISEGSGAGIKVVVQWSSGVSATVSEVIIQATVMLLAVCQADANDTSLTDLWEFWFPSVDVQPYIRPLDSSTTVHRPRVALTDDSICPDFLRMLMLRSGRQRLLDAALEGVSTTKLLIFVQSFGVPTAGASRLLRALDELSLSRPEEVLAASEDRRDYLVELVDVQHARGVVEGVRFRSLLLDGGAHASRSAAAAAAATVADGPVGQFSLGGSSMAPTAVDHTRRLEPSVRSDRGGDSSTVNVPDTLADMVEFIRTGILNSRPPASTVRRLCRALQIKMAAQEPVRHAFVCACNQILKTATGLELAKAFWTISTDVAPVLRLVVGMLRPNSKARSHSESEAAAATVALFEALLRCDPCKGNSSGPLHTVVTKAAAWLHPDMEASSAGDVDHIDLRDSKTELAVSTTMTELVLAGRSDEAAKLCIRKIDELERSELPRPATSVGLLVDWLQAVNLEVVSSSVACDQSGVDREALRLLFGRRCGVAAGTACSTYLRAVLLHQASWDTVRSVIGCLLGSDQAIGDKWELDPTAVLDFLTGCLHQPKLYQGRVRKKPRKSRPDDVLGLAADAVCRVAQLVVRESAGKSKPAVVKGLDGRVELLCACCHEDPDKLRALARHVEARVLARRRGPTGSLSTAPAAAILQPTPSCRDYSPGGGSSSSNMASEYQAYEYLLVRLYAWAPRIIKWLSDDGDALDDDPVVLLHGPCALDTQTHKVLTALGAAVGPKKKHETALNEANLLCRKLATDHPLLFLRQLPMMLALLSGRCAFTFNEFKHRNHLLLFTHVFGIAELLQPHLFGHPSFGEFVSLYLDFFKVYSQKALATFFGKFVQLLHNFVHCMPSRMAQVLSGHAAVLGYLCSVYPAMSQAKSLLSAVSMPQKEASGAPSDEEKRSAMPVLNPPLTAEQLAPFRARLNKDASVDDVLAVLKDIDSTSMIKVDILTNFIDDLKRLLSTSSNECRNTAHVLMMRCLRHSPRYARDFVDSYASCLEHENCDVKKSALLNLAEFTVLCDEDDAALLLQRAFVAALKLDGGESMTHVKEALQLLNLENVQIT